VGAQELDDFCRQNMAGFKRPKAYHFLSSLPKNNNGKVLKTHLRATYAAPTLTPTPAVAVEPPVTPKDRT
jgi:acyl-CoA synthetase (AMP-forming)/AMP-acid ligase II